MSDKIRPNEVSEILFQQLQQLNDGQDFDEIALFLLLVMALRVSTDCEMPKPMSCLNLRMEPWLSS